MDRRQLSCFSSSYSFQPQAFGERFAEHFALFFDVQLTTVTDQFDQMHRGVMVFQPVDGLRTVFRRDIAIAIIRATSQLHDGQGLGWFVYPDVSTVRRANARSSREARPY